MTAERLSTEMDRQGIDQSELAARIGVTQGAISKILVGRTANSRLLPKIASTLGVSLPWLLGESEGLEDSTGYEALGMQERQWLDALNDLAPEDRKMLLHLAFRLASTKEEATLHSPKTDYRPENTQ